MLIFPKIVQVVPTEEHTVHVYFEDGKVNANFSSGYRRIIEYNPDGSIKSQNIVE